MATRRDVARSFLTMRAEKPPPPLEVCASGALVGRRQECRRSQYAPPLLMRFAGPNNVSTRIHVC